MSHPHQQPLLDVRGLRVQFQTPYGLTTVVDDVSFQLNRGEVLALVGESGSGKSITASSLINLLPGAGRVVGGEVWLDGEDVLTLRDSALQHVRGGRIGYVFQDLSALNPVMSIGAQVAEAVRLHQPALSHRAAWARAIELFQQVGLPSPVHRAKSAPHQLSGGQRQRVLLAMALAGDPDVLVADEPTTALDVSTQAQILALLKKLQQDRGLALLLISHDLSVVKAMADRIAVMYAGKIVEVGDAQALTHAPHHPYTTGLLASVDLHRTQPGTRLPEIGGSVPSLHALPIGCAFAPRCHQASAPCLSTRPALAALAASGGHRAAACWTPMAWPTQEAA